MNEDQRRGDGTWLIVFLILLAVGVGAPKAAHHHKRPAGSTPAAKVDAPLPAVADIPASYLMLYRKAGGSCRGLSWSVLAGIGKVETNHGRSRLPGVRSGVNTFGCCAGPMQFNIRNGPTTTWDRYGQGGNVYDPHDAIPAAARLLCANSIGTWTGADPCPGVLGSAGQHHAILRYNAACWYARQVLSLARSYQAGRR
jgi:hypothetical protein